MALVEMRVHVDEAGPDDAAREIDALRRRAGRLNGGHDAVLEPHIGIVQIPFPRGTEMNT